MADLDKKPSFCANCQSEILNRGELIRTVDGNEFCDDECYYNFHGKKAAGLIGTEEGATEPKKTLRIHIFIEQGVVTQCAMDGDLDERRSYDIIIESDNGSRNTAERYLVADRPSLSDSIWGELLAQVEAEGGDGSPEGIWGEDAYIV